MRRTILLVATLLAAALAGCSSPVELRQLVIATDAQWRMGGMEPESFEAMLASVRSLGAQPTGDEARLAAIPELARLVLDDPSSLVRAESLRAAWRLAAELPVDAWRVDALDRADFNGRTQRLEALVTAEDAATQPEALELAGWLAHFHAPPEQPRLGVTVAEVVASQALWRHDALGDAFRKELASSLRHALALVTLHAANDPHAVVREEALASARHLDPPAVLSLVAGVLARETDSAVLLAALDSLQEAAGALPAEDVRAVLEPLQGSTDVAVRLRIRDILALASS